jgi:hypothetical protein
MTDQYISQDRVKVDVFPPSGVTMPGPWMQFSGHGGEREVTTKKPGVGEAQVQTRSKSKLKDVTIVKMFNAGTDWPTVKKLQDPNKDHFAGSKLVTVDVDTDEVPIPGTTNTLYGCSVKSWDLSDVDVNGADDRTLTVVFTPTRAD